MYEYLLENLIVNYIIFLGNRTVVAKVVVNVVRPAY